MPEKSAAPEKKFSPQTDQTRFLRSFNVKIDKPMMAEIFINSLGIHIRQIPDLVIRSMDVIRDPFATQNESEDWNRIEKLMRAINSVLIPSSAKPDAFGNFHIWDVKVQYEDLLPKLLPFSRMAYDWMQAGEAFSKANLWREAELAHRIALHCEPGNPAIQSYIADDMDKQGLFGEAEQLMAGLVEDNPTITPARINLSHLRLFSMNNVEAAGQAAAKATQVGPDDPDAWVQYAYCLYYAGKKRRLPSQARMHDNVLKGGIPRALKGC